MAALDVQVQAAEQTVAAIGAGLAVHADVTDEVHLHSYDLHADVTPSEPARIDFVADVAGVFECELEGAGTLLFRLEITP